MSKRPPVKRLAALAALSMGLLAGGPGRAGGAQVHAACRRTAPRTYEVEGSFEVRATSRAAWEVLTDYGHLSRFVSGLRESRVRERGEGRVLLEQEGAGRVFLLSRKARVLLEVREEPLRRLLFKDVSSGDFELYEGSWTIEPGKDGLALSYRLKAKPAFWAPSLLAGRALRRGAKSLLKEVRAEIIRRGGEP